MKAWGRVEGSLDWFLPREGRRSRAANEAMTLHAAVAPGADGSSAPSIGRLVGLTLAFSVLFALLWAAPAFAAAPVPTLEAPSGINKTTAHLSGTINPEAGPGTTCFHFEYVRKARLEAGEENWNWANYECFSPADSAKSEAIPAAFDLSGLRGSTVYLVRLGASNEAGEGTSAEEEFETLSVIQPTATIEAASGIGYSTAHVQGHVNPEAGPGTTCWSFEIVRKAKLEAHEERWNVAQSECFSEEDSAKTEPLPVSADLTGLRSTVYLVRLSASNAEGDGVSPREEFETKAVTPPSVTIKPVTGITAFSATFAGTVNPNSPEPAPASPDVEGGFHTSWRFECEPQCGGGSGELAADNTTSEIEREAVLKPNKTYLVKLVAENGGGPTVAQTTFETPKVPPTVAYLPLAPVSMVTDEEARLGGFVDPRESGALTDCHFDYGPTASYGSSAPCELHGEDTYVSAHLTGLQPNTTYHFRLVAANTVETVVAGDQQFKTFAVPPGEPACPNEEARKEQKATMLPECRAWEMVSPVDKNGGNVDFEAWSVYAADDGNAVSFRSRGSFGDTKGSGGLGQTAYISRRGTGGWETHGLYPVSDPRAQPAFVGITLVGQFSEDLSHDIMMALDLPEVSGDLANGPNDYWQDTRTLELTTITHSFAATPSLGEFAFAHNVALEGSASADQHVISFTAQTALLPEAPEGVQSVYEWEEGKLRLASILPDGSIYTEGANSPSFGIYRGGEVSPDGSLVGFYAAKEGSEQFYVRRNHTDTAWVSEPEGSAPISVAENVHLQYISPDSRHILFTTTSQLVSEDTNESNDLYMWTDGPNPASEDNLTLISGNGDNVPGGEVLIGTSRDASYIYYLANPEGSPQIVLWKNGTRHMAAPTGSAAMTVHESPGTARVSANGKILAFITQGSGFSERGLTGDIVHGNKELYIYDSEGETLTCASCAQSVPAPEEEGEEGEAEAEPETHFGVIVEPGYEVPEYERGLGSGTPGQPRYLSADGSHVFFSTGEALVPEDKNEAVDAYEYDIETGQQRLLSSGRGETASLFANASTDGREVAFVTHQALVGRDVDTLADIYEARVDGGFVEPPPPPTPCVGDGCRGVIPAAPQDPSPSTPRFSGPGNPPPHHRHTHHKKHHRKKHRKHHHGGGK